MEDSPEIPINIRNIGPSKSKIGHREILATFHYRLPGPVIDVRRETVQFPRTLPFDVLYGQEFDEPAIKQWVAGFGGQWDVAEFLFEKMKELGGSLPDLLK